MRQRKSTQVNTSQQSLTLARPNSDVDVRPALRHSSSGSLMDLSTNTQTSLITVATASDARELSRVTSETRRQSRQVWTQVWTKVCNPITHLGPHPPCKSTSFDAKACPTTRPPH